MTPVTWSLEEIFGSKYSNEYTENTNSLESRHYVKKRDYMCIALQRQRNNSSSFQTKIRIPPLIALPWQLTLASAFTSHPDFIPHASTSGVYAAAVRSALNCRLGADCSLVYEMGSRVCPHFIAPVPLYTCTQIGRSWRFIEQSNE